MSTDLVSQARTEERRRRRTVRAVAIASLGPLAAGAGVVWGVAQPYRVTLFHPHGQGFWNLIVEPPLLVILVGVLFQFFVVSALLEDMSEEEHT